MLQSTQAGMPGIFLGWQKQCKSPLAYREVGKGREQDAEALRAIWAVTIEVVALFAIRPQAGSYIYFGQAASLLNLSILHVFLCWRRKNSRNKWNCSSALPHRINF